MRRFVAVLLALLMFSLSCLAQDEPNDNAYFSLSTNRTWAPGQKPTISVWGRNIHTLEFRVYRVNDPVKFFQTIQDAHSFGGRAPQVPHVTNWIERFHGWKHEVWTGFRDFFRRQYTPEARAQIRDWMLNRNRVPVQKGDTYAQVPVLNRQQLVATWRESVVQKESWEAATVQVPVTDKGVYLVEATNGKLRAYTIVMIDQIAMVTKTAPGRVLVFVADRKTGAPVADAQVQVWTKGSAPTSLKTDADGLAETPISEQKPEAAVVVAQYKGDFAVNTPGSYWLRSDSDATLTGYVYTDRPVYRPGDTVHYKIILRSRQHGVYQLPPARQLTMEVRDATYKVVSRSLASPSADYGTIKGEYVVPADASLGNYQLEVSSDQVRGTGSFYIEEYKKPEYDVRVTTEAKRVLQGNPIRATIEARYFFGEPVAGAKVTWVLHKWRYWAWDYPQEDESQATSGEEGEGGGDEGGEEVGRYGGEQETEKTGVLDADGRLKIEIPTAPDDKAKFDFTYRIEARVTDQSNREITGHGYVLGTYGSFYLQLRPDSYVYEAGGQAKVTVEAFDYDKKPIATAFELKVDEEHYPPPAKTVFTTSGQTDANGHAVITVPVGKAGTFVVEARATTPENRQVENRTWLWVTSKAPGWMWPTSAQIKIIPDQKTYKPGDTAHMLVLTGGPAHVLLTTEGGDLYSRRVVSTTESSLTVDIPVLATYSPNFFVTAVFLRDNEEHQGSKSILVPPDEHKLQVQVLPSKPQFQPGEAASYTIKAADNAGKPVAAEFSLGVVDEAIYSIHPEAAIDIVKEFYGSTYNQVGTETSLTYYFHGEAGHRQMQLTDVRRSRALAQIKPERLVQPKVRKAFPDTAYWVADVKTDTSGTAQVRFDFPDALTAWRATARGITRDSKVGSDVEKVIVRKNVMVRLAVPRFFRHDDEVTIGVLVHNYLTDAKTARVSLEVKGLTIIDGATRDVQVPSRGEVTVNWRVKAQKTTQAVLLAKALTNVESDAMEITLAVEPYGVKQSIAKSGAIGDGGQHDETILFPATAEQTSRKLELSVTPSIAGAIFGALEYLTAYPYGCTEQTMSSFLPNIIVAQAIKDLGLKTNIDNAELQKKIRVGIERLYTYQHDDGGWGWWQTDDTHVFMTAYVLAGLSEAKRAGYDVKDDSLNKARQWLSAKFKSDPKVIPDLRAYMAYALAESGDTSAIGAVWDQRSELSPYGAALLGLAMIDAKDARAAELAPQIERAAQSNNEEAWWEQKRDPMLDFTEDISAEATAYILKFLSHVRPDSPLLPKAGVWLVTHRDEGWWWDSTKQTAFVIYGLTDYLKQSGELKPDYSVDVELNGKVVLSKRFTPADALLLERPVIRLDASQLAEANKIVVRKKGTGRVYWSARADYWSDEKRLVNQGSFALNVAREYYRLSPVREDNKIVYDLSRVNGPLQVGEVVAVRLTVSGSEWKYLLIEDPIPGGTEFIEKDEFYQLKNNLPSWWTRWYTRREYHDDRVAMFQTYFGRQSEYVYLLKVVNPGIFRVSPARVQPMYQPAFQATSDGATVEVK